MVYRSRMSEIDRIRTRRHGRGMPPPPQEVLAAENVSLRLLLAQAEINAQGLLAQAGIDAKERAASDKLQKLILEELHHRIKNTLATVSAIAHQSLRNAPDLEHARHAIEGRLLALGRAHDLLLQAQWTSADLGKIVRAATEPFDDKEVAKFSIGGPDIQIASGAVISLRDDAQRALHQHDEIRRPVGACRPRRHRMDCRRSRVAFEFQLDRKIGPRCSCPGKTELWHAFD